MNSSPSVPGVPDADGDEEDYGIGDGGDGGDGGWRDSAAAGEGRRPERRSESVVNVQSSGTDFRSADYGAWCCS